MSFERVWHRQHNGYSCGRAAAATAVSLFNVISGVKAPSLAEVYNRMGLCLNPDPEIGVHPQTMINVLSKELPVRQAGAGLTHEGRVTVALVEDWDIAASGELIRVDHYITVLGMKGPDVTYFDPWDGKITTKHVDDLEWRSGFYADDPFLARQFGVQLDFEGAAVLRALKGEPSKSFMIVPAGHDLIRH